MANHPQDSKFVRDWTFPTDSVVAPPEYPVVDWVSSRYTARMMGRNAEHESEITEFDPPHRICFRTPTGSMPLEGCCTLEARDGQTLVTIAAEGTVEGLLGFAEPLIEKMADRMSRTNLENLQEQIEGDDL